MYRGDVGILKVVRLANDVRYFAKNWIKVIINVYILKKYPFILNFKKTKGSKIINDEEDWWALKGIYGTFGPSYSAENDLLTLQHEGQTVKLYGASYSAATEVFSENEYSFLNVQDRMVLDIGANICDTAVYFCLRGAKGVIAVEPFPIHFDFGRRNVNVNGLDNKVVLLNGGVGKQDGEINIKNDDNINATSPLVCGGEGLKVHIYSLSYLLENFNLKNSILKIDCEGCEYEVITEENRNVLSNFREIYLEYHYGPQPISDVLKNIGFKVITSEPKIHYNPKINRQVTYGTIHAIRN